MAPSAKKKSDPFVHLSTVRETDEREAPPGRFRSLLTLAALGATVAGAASLGARSTTARSRWYRTLRKSPLNPPPSVFGPVWSVLYSLMAFSAWRVWRSGEGAQRRKALALWAGQLGLNAVWSPIFFGAHRPKAALADLVGTLGATGAYVRAAAPISKAAAASMVPYLGWLAFAGVLNGEVVRRN